MGRVLEKTCRCLGVVAAASAFAVLPSAVPAAASTHHLAKTDLQVQSQIFTLGAAARPLADLGATQP